MGNDGGLIVDRSPTPEPLVLERRYGNDGMEMDDGHVLEEKYMWFGFMDLVMHPAETLPTTIVIRHQPGRTKWGRRWPRHTWVMPSPLHSSSHSSFNVPLEGSK